MYCRVYIFMHMLGFCKNFKRIITFAPVASRSKAPVRKQGVAGLIPGGNKYFYFDFLLRIPGS